MADLRDLFTFPDKKAFGLTLLVSGIEDYGLLAWLYLARLGAGYLGLDPAPFVLLVFLSIEHQITQASAHPLTVRSFFAVEGFTVLEVLNWVIWLALIPLSPVIAGLYFVVGFYIEHQITDNVKKGLDSLHFSPADSIVAQGLALLTLSEFVGAALWITFGTPGIVALVLGSVIEHYIAYNVGKMQD